MWEAVGARKAFLVESAEELRAEYLRISSISPEIMLQQYVYGADSDVAVCCCFINAKQEMAAYFTARKLRQNPPLFGTGCAVETVNVPEIVPLAKRLLQGSGYCGIAEVEFKRDSRAGKWFLIEVNPRHWDQHEIGTHIGVNLSWIAYQDMIGRPCSPQVPLKTAAQFRWIAETEALMLALRNAYLQLQRDSLLSGSMKRWLAVRIRAVKTFFLEIGFLLKGRTVFAILHRRDPLPGILLFLRTGRELLELLGRHMTRHSRTGHATVD